MQTNLTQIAKAYLGSAAFFAIAGEGFMFALDTYRYTARPDYLLPAVVAFSLPAVPFGYYLAGRVAQLARPPQKVGPVYVDNRSISLNNSRGQSSILASAVSWVVPRRGLPGVVSQKETDWQTKSIGYKPPRQAEFVFWEKGMTSLITEARLLNFCKVAWRRQQMVDFGDLRSNQVFSRVYFTKQARPRFPSADYQSVMHVIKSRSLAVNRWQGKGGALLYPPGITVEEAKRRW